MQKGTASPSSSPSSLPLHYHYYWTIVVRVSSFSCCFVSFISEQCRNHRRRRRHRFHFRFRFRFRSRYGNSRLKLHHMPISRRSRYIIDLSRPSVSNSKEERKTIVPLLNDDVRQEHYYLLDDTWQRWWQWLQWWRRMCAWYMVRSRLDLTHYNS